MAAERLPWTQDDNPMLWTLTIVFLALWGIGHIAHFTIGGLIHILLLAAIVSALFEVVGGRRAA
jgi:hypothetical protein